MKRFLLIGQRESVLDVLAAHPAVDLSVVLRLVALT